MGRKNRGCRGGMAERFWDGLTQAGRVATHRIVTCYILSKQPELWSWSLKGDAASGPGNDMNVLL